MNYPRLGDWMLRLVVGGALVFAGGLKAGDPAAFALAVGNYRLVPDVLINAVAIVIPWIELAAGVFVLAGVWLRAAAFVIACLTTLFFVVIVSALARGLNIECGCFGTIGGKHIGLVNLAIDVTLLVLSGLLVWRSKDDRVVRGDKENGATGSVPSLNVSRQS